MNPAHQDDRVSIILDLTIKLKQKGSWCGETHIQKTAFILKSFGVDELDYDFILYKHGPYSFELHSELAIVRNANLISLVVLQDRYGPSFEVTEIWGTRFLERHQEKVKRIKKKVSFVVEWVGDRDVKSLEKIATALMIMSENPTKTADARAQILNRLKPHISLAEAENATKQVELKLDEARRQKIFPQ
ncbi:hypothetical protein [Mesorhizobium sp. WSM3626]|uniref:hypothetical protein n=1 Tax=Mesorhizobium sp. WSM3626 TaxID=1040987 RepID=UPI00048904F3|nr:hypothetical protein [Mesorhizobium sp. WSM3626]